MGTCLHCGKKIKDNDLSYCDDCFNELKKNGMFKEKKKEYYCRICGRPLTDGDNIKKELCGKHCQQIKKYGFNLDDNQRNEYDLNEYEIKGNMAYLKLYDNFQEELNEKAIIDDCTVELINKYRWDKNRTCITTNINGKIIPLENYILNTNEKVNFKNGNNLDFRLNNLMVIHKDVKDKKIDKRKKGKIDLISYGFSSQQVTGSSWGVYYDNIKENKRDMLLIECGLVQGKDVVTDYNNNKKMISNIPFERCGQMIFSHCHLDHLMNAVASIKKGFNGIVYMTKTQRILAEKLLLDGAYIHERNVKELKNKGKSPELFYDESSVYLFLNKVKIVEMNEKIKINNNITFRFRNNSHVLGATQIELWITKPNNQIKHILYTGDLGTNHNFEFQPFLKQNDIVKSCDLAIFESTYSDIKRSFTKKDCIIEREDFRNTLLNTIQNKSRCLVPTFSFSRGQMLMCWVYDWFKDLKDNFQVVIDSKLFQEINNAYTQILEDEDLEYWSNIMSWDKFKFVGDYKETLELSSKNDGIPKIILSSSGFMEAGRVRTWATKILNNKEDTICFVGYSTPNSLANKIQNQKENILIIDGIRCVKNCNIKTYRTFSSHIQYDELLDYFYKLKTNKIILHHGDLESKDEFRKYATKLLREKGITTKIICTNKNNIEFDL